MGDTRNSYAKTDPDGLYFSDIEVLVINATMEMYYQNAWIQYSNHTNPLKRIVIGDGIKYFIAGQYFSAENCPALETVEVSDSVRYIGAGNSNATFYLKKFASPKVKPNGTIGTVVTDKSGTITEIRATVSTTAVTEAANTGKAVTLPVEIPAAKATENALAVQITVPKNIGPVKVEIPVQNVTPGTVAVIVNADGTEKIVPTSVVTENGVVLTLNSSASVKVIDNAKTFSDVPADNVFYNEICALSAREIMIGISSEEFDLNSSMTLDQIANVAGRIIGAVDVSDFRRGIAWGAENGLKTGNVAATRGEVLKALYIAAGSPVVEDTTILSRFKDASGISSDLVFAAAWAAQNGILKGGTDGNASLNANVTRSQACALAGRTMGALT